MAIKPCQPILRPRVRPRPPAAALLVALALSVALHASDAPGGDPKPELIARWPLAGGPDPTAGSFRLTTRGVDFTAKGPGGGESTAARFNGRDAAATGDGIALGPDPFSISLWVNVLASSGDSPGDLISQYDPVTRTGFNLGIHSHGGVTNSQPNSRQLHFGIDQGRIEPGFADHGRPGTAVFIFALLAHEGRLFAATCHAGAEEAGHVFVLDGEDKWSDLGSPDKANAISAMAVFEGAVHVASGKYRLAGSSLAESANAHKGGRVFRLGAGDRWIDCGEVSPETEAISALAVFRGALHASSLYKPAGFFRYEKGDGRNEEDGGTPGRWIACPTPGGLRTEALLVHNDALYATCYDEAAIFRYDGAQWEKIGLLPEATQTYGLAVHRGDLYVSEWPGARVFRRAGGNEWVNAGKLGDELEAMPLLVYNGKMYGGTLPLAGVYRYDGDGDWTGIGRVDTTPDVKYRRAWSMAVHRGRLFVGTLPSGHVLSIEAGRNATWTHEFPSGWHHIVAARTRDRLELYVDGGMVAGAGPFAAEEGYNLTNPAPLQIGFGAQDYFNGEIADVRIYRGVPGAGDMRGLMDGRGR